MTAASLPKDTLPHSKRTKRGLYFVGAGLHTDSKVPAMGAR